MIRTLLALAVSLTAFPSISSAETGKAQLIHKANEAQRRLELTGHFDSNWAEEELRREISAHCTRRGKVLVQFRTTGVDALLGTSFVATCQ